MPSFRKILSATAVAGLMVLCTGGALLFGQQRDESRGALPRTQPVEAQQDAQQSDVQPPQEASADYVIGPEDILKIDVFQVPDLSNLQVRVANDGTVTVPLLGRVPASGLTATQLARSLEAKWGKNYLENPEVNIFVQQFQAKPVSVIGAVEKPGLYYLTGPRTLIEMLSMAGGLAKRTSDVAGPTLYVTRRGGFEDVWPFPGMKLVAPDKLEIDIQKLLYSNQPGLNIPIRPLDIISVSKAGVVYVLGQGVKMPGGFILEDRDQVTVLQALAMAGGLSQDAAKRYARIIHQKTDGSKVQIPIDLDKITKGKAPDPALAANDILFVPNSAQKAALKRAVDATVSTLSGVLVFRGL